VRLLLDTHTLLWALKGVLDEAAKQIIIDANNTLYFSPVNLWEIELKAQKLNTTAAQIQRCLIASGYFELPLSSRHVLGLSTLPKLHDDPFDRILLAQAHSERMLLMSADAQIAGYSQHLDCILSF